MAITSDEAKESRKHFQWTFSLKITRVLITDHPFFLNFIDMKRKYAVNAWSDQISLAECRLACRCGKNFYIWKMYLIWWSSDSLYSLECQLIVIVGDLDLRCCAIVARNICGLRIINSLGLLGHNCPAVCIAGLVHTYPRRMSSSYETTQSSLIMQRSTHVPFLWIFTTEFASRVRKRKRDWVLCWHGVIPTKLVHGWSRDRLHSYSLWTVSFRLTEFGFGTIIFSSRKTREMCERRPFR